MSTDWAGLFEAAILRLPAVAARAPLTFCGNGACIDARVSMHNIDPMLASDLPAAAGFARLLQTRAARRQGGELSCHWPDGPAWIGTNLPVAYAMGGTGPHAASALAAVGAPVLLALADRSEQMLGLVPANVLLAEGGHPTRAGSAARRGVPGIPVFIFEYTAGRPIGEVVPTRSSRIIVRFGNFLLQDDPEFERISVARAADAGAGLVSGFSSVAPADLPTQTARVAALARAWRAAGLATVHLELAGFETLELLRATLRALRGVVTSVGMSLSELRSIQGDGRDVAAEMQSLGEELGVDRMCVHADDWAASVTKRDAAVELHALVTGCLLASARAAAGRHVLPERLDAAACFGALPFDRSRTLGQWTFVACASPYLRAPRTTLGLGDTFTGGCLLALGVGMRGMIDGLR